MTRQVQLTSPGAERQQARFVLFGVMAYALLLGLASLTMALESVSIAAGVGPGSPW